MFYDLSDQIVTSSSGVMTAEFVCAFYERPV